MYNVAIVAQQSISSIDAYLERVEAGLAVLGDKRLQQLLLMQHSPRYIDRVVSHLDLQAGKAEKIHRAIQQLHDKNAELAEEIATNQQQIQAWILTTRTLKAQVNYRYIFVSS
jgi:hypothetical protein